MPEISNKRWLQFIGDEWKTSESGGEIDVKNPATGEVLTQVPQGTEKDIEEAIDVAQDSFKMWQLSTPTERAELLFDIGSRLEEYHEEIARLETLETGKPISQSEFDVQSAIDSFKFYAGAADKFYSESIEHSLTRIAKTVVEPYGVVGVIIPWNWPPMHIADFTSVGLATGNSVVLKPSPEAPLTSIRFAEVLQDLLPVGVFNVVTGGTGPGAALAAHEGVDLISFTGSDRTGEKILEACAKNITPSILELGGKNTEIIFPDADIEKAVTGFVCNAFHTSGQACSNTEKLLLHEDIEETFLGHLTDRMQKLKVGDGLKEETQVGPMVSKEHRERVRSYLSVIEDQVIVQSDTPTEKRLQDGYWVPPSVFTDVMDYPNLANEEVFGPIVGVSVFKDENHAMALTNDTEFGLVTSIWTTDLSRANRIARKAKSGVISINSRMKTVPGLPFGGYGRSGIGRKKGFEDTMRAFSQTKSVYVDLTNEHHHL